MNQLERKNKKKNFIWNAIGLSFYSFNSLFLLIIIKAINGIDTAGIFTYAFALGCLFFVFATYYNRTFQASDHKNRFSFNEYLTCRLILSVVSFIAFISFACINQFDFFKILVIALILILRIVESISDCFYGAIQKNGELYKTGVSYTIKSLGSIILFLAMDLLTHNLLISIGAMIVANLIVLFYYDIPSYYKKSTNKFHCEYAQLKQIIKTCFPIFIFSALSIYIMNCQKYILTYFASNDIQTIFGILIMPATFLSIIGMYLVNPFVNHMTTLHIQKDYLSFRRKTYKILSILILSGVLCIAVCWVLGIPILNTLYSMDLYEYRNPLIAIVAASILYASVTIMSSFLTILKINGWQSIFYCIASIAATILAIILIPHFGITGATLSFAITGILLTLLYSVFLYAKLHTLIMETQNAK